MLFNNEDEILDRLKSDQNVLNLINSQIQQSNDLESHINEEDSEELDIKDIDLDIKDIINGGDGLAKLGRPSGSKAYSFEDRAELSVMKDLLGSNAVRELFGVSAAQPHNHALGKINHQDQVNKHPLLSNIISRRKDSIRNISTKKLKEVLEVVDTESIESLRGNPLKATAVATNLARITEKMEPKEVAQKNTANFIIMQPTQAQESEYDVIDV